MMPDDKTAADPPFDPSGEVRIDPLLRSLSFLLRRAEAAVIEDFNERFAAEDIRPAQFAVLTVLKLNPGLRQSQTSKALGIKRTNLVPLLDELERRGLAERRRLAGDRRAAALFLTASGRETIARLETIARAHEAHFARRLKGLDQHVTLLNMLDMVQNPSMAL